MHHFFVPQFVPKTLDELPQEPDEVTSLVYMEDSIAKELNAIREYKKNERPLGQPPQPEEVPSEPEEEAVMDDSPASDGESSDFQGSDEGNDDDEGDMV